MTAKPQALGLQAVKTSLRAFLHLAKLFMTVVMPRLSALALVVWMVTLRLPPAVKSVPKSLPGASNLHSNVVLCKFALYIAG